MIDDSGRLTKPIVYGGIVVCALITIALAFQLWIGFLSFSSTPLVFIFAFVSNVILLPTLLILSTKNKRLILPTVILLHASMSVVLLYFSQIYSPFTVAWAVLILLSTGCYGWRGFWASSASLVLLTALYVWMFPEILEQEGGLVTYAILSAIVSVLTILTSYVFVTVLMGARKKNEALMQAQRSENLQVNRLNTLLNSITDAVLTLNRYGRITSQNAAAQAFFDTNETLIGKDIDKILHLADQNDKYIGLHDLMQSVKSGLHRDDLSTKDVEEVRHVSMQMSRIRGNFDDDEEYGVVVILRDITKQKSLEEEKDEFISVTSHELRTPVAIAEGGMSNLLLMHDRNMDRDKLRESMQTAYEQIIYLAKIVNDLSTLSRADRGVGDAAEEIDVGALLQDMHQRYHDEAANKDLRLDLEIISNLPRAIVSRLYLEEILQNLITNAIKYTKEGSVTIGAKLLDNGQIECWVRDTGIGIGKADTDKIFQKFYRSEDYRTRETSGTGLGLYVVTKLAAKLNTKIEVESRLNHGSTFRFIIPMIANK